MEHLFVYGTLRKTAGHSMNRVLEQHAEWLGEATLQGKLYLIDWYPALIRSDHSMEQVKGEVYRLHQPERIFAELDPYEGYYPHDEDHSDYLRRIEPVRLADGTPLRSWVYLYNLPVLGLTRIPSGDFFQR
ncbi:gamma-glutamylcyclotransferase family protein [Siphonobacter aquaeclarae]|uniref:Uncharacterized conserved protein YtfP, gamma-glutamylcyclotransferase (GGCT)/AIG2-like family n=1 Tax=Siphonobacter aquaeclarae TaxID=563176 RepID=A0A1G9NKA9_9BACT|nr:gamma-glutamylcyclotransferase family protein [Siphonobacter aquaeclarae]MBO9636632.1 gamma-glutamylcyclotransferase [Siphonobacter aquaeclarae]SDL86781.1 Uncharacterized conserved protein YtfP, gamma-glutamylcyclotransferase (GGCT)/AIG2-like family [Siphonobacter aquaeclarae]